MKDYFILPYSLTQIVEKVYFYSQTEFDKNNGLYVTASIGEEFRLKCLEQSFQMQLSIENLKSQINNKSWHLSFDDSSFSKVKAHAEVYNLCAERLYAPLRDILRPVWNVYWGESATSLGTIATWLIKADEDKGAKVFAKLEASKEQSS
jgi:hypothetical protein